jgi:hypothetical protein
MGASNYPAGVSDAHPHFNPQEATVTGTCTADDLTVVPVHVVREAIDGLTDLAKRYRRAEEAGRPTGTITLQLETALLMLTERLQADQIEGSGLECEFEGEVDAQLQGDVARWDCPVCGHENETDVGPDDDDDDYDRRRDEAMEREWE